MQKARPGEPERASNAEPDGSTLMFDFGRFP